MKSVYAAWMGHPVVMQLASDDLRVPLRGTVVGESDAVVRFRLGDGLDVDIYKKMIWPLRKTRSRVFSLPRINRDCRRREPDPTQRRAPALAETDRR